MFSPKLVGKEGSTVRDYGRFVGDSRTWRQGMMAVLLLRSADTSADDTASAKNHSLRTARSPSTHPNSLNSEFPTSRKKPSAHPTVFRGHLDPGKDPNRGSTRSPT